MPNLLEYSINSNAYSCGIDHVCLPPEKLIDLHTQDTWELVYIITGSGVRTIGNTTEPFHKSEIILIPPQMPHGWSFDTKDTDANGNIEDIALVFTDDMLRRCADTFPELKQGIEDILNHRQAILMDESLQAPLSSLLWQMTTEDDLSRTVSLLRIFTLIVQGKGKGIAEEYRPTNRIQDRICRLQIFINCNYFRNISLHDAAEHLGMHPSAFCTFLKHATGKTFTVHLNEYRIHVACRFLREKADANISEIAYQTGFNTICYFNRIFKQIMGMSPLAYRKSALED